MKHRITHICAPIPRLAGIWPALAATLLVGGCTTLQPTDLPMEVALPAAQGPFWSAINQAHKDDWFYLLNEGDEAIEWRLRMIDTAQVSIEMETFLWKPDKSGAQIMAHLIAAADRGVRVRVLLDDSFTMHEDLALHAVDEHPNMEFRLYNPFRHRSDGVIWRQLFNIGDFGRINHRMHNKALVVDGRAALIGGRNLADEYFGEHEELNFRDMEVITSGASVPEVVDHFDRFWNSGWAFAVADVIKVPADAPGLQDVRDWLVINATMPVLSDRGVLQAQWQAIAGLAYPGFAEFFFDQPASRDPTDPDEQPDELAAELRGLIERAQREVILVSAYFIPTRELEEVVERAEARGVKVRILTNSLQSNNHLAAHAAYRGHMERLVDHGADLHEVRATAKDRQQYMSLPVEEKQLGLHAKLLLIDDDIAFIGSCNLDPRSLKINTEVGLVIKSLALNQALRERLAIDFELRNAWAVQRSPDGGLMWVGHDQVLNSQPSGSAIARLEDWFIGLLPIDGQM